MIKIHRKLTDGGREASVALEDKTCFNATKKNINLHYTACTLDFSNKLFELNDRFEVYEVQCVKVSFFIICEPNNQK